MNADEIKQHISMRSVLEDYGITINRADFCKCPFHGAGKERTASMKIYDTSFYCFGCNESGDAFSFVQKYEGVSFKEAFLKLGGEYENTTDSEKERLRREWQQKRLNGKELIMKKSILKQYKRYADINTVNER